MFGIASLPAGRYGDLWGRRAMMIVFFFGMGVSLLLVALTQSPLQIGIALTLMGAFSAIYHPVGIPMLLQHAKKAGAVIGVNGRQPRHCLCRAVDRFLVACWLACGVRGARVCCRSCLGPPFVWLVPREARIARRQTRREIAADIDHATAVRVFAVLTCTTTLGSLIFNFTTNGNGELLRRTGCGHRKRPCCALGCCSLASMPSPRFLCDRGSPD